MFSFDIEASHSQMEMDELCFGGFEFSDFWLIKLEPEFWIPSVDSLAAVLEEQLIPLGQPSSVTGKIHKGDRGCGI